MASAGNAFETYAKFGKTEAQLKEAKGGLRIEQKNIQKLMKEKMLPSLYIYCRLSQSKRFPKNQFFINKSIR